MRSGIGFLIESEKVNPQIVMNYQKLTRQLQENQFGIGYGRIGMMTPTGHCNY